LTARLNNITSVICHRRRRSEGGISRLAPRKLAYKSMAFIAEDNGGSISWKCKPYPDPGAGPIDEKYLPKECS